MPRSAAPWCAKKDFDTICQTAEDYLGSELHGIRTFKVEARRADKTYPMTSPELMRELGAYLLGKHNYLKVDVHNPQFKVIVEIRDYGAYIHGPKIQGEGGLPVGTSGRALNMLSGGIDSPVAAYRMAKRGLALDHIHFASPPYTSERAKLKSKGSCAAYHCVYRQRQPVCGALHKNRRNTSGIMPRMCCSRC